MGGRSTSENGNVSSDSVGRFEGEMRFFMVGRSYLWSLRLDFPRTRERAVDFAHSYKLGGLASLLSFGCGFFCGCGLEDSVVASE